MRGLGKLLHHFWEVLIGFLYQNYKKKVKKSKSIDLSKEFGEFLC